jgi:Mg2+ and Co2+ transporter CorA
MIRALTSLEERASRKIDLQYNIENQEDSQTNLKIAKLTTDIAVYTQKDSSSMITMAAVTMFFLPGTFVSALFSMVFFNLDPTTNELTSAPHIWVFLAITIPLTMAVFVVWKLWSIWRSKKIDGQMDLEGGGLLGNDRLTNEGNPKTSIKSSPTPKEAW